MTHESVHKHAAETDRENTALDAQQRLPCRGCTADCRWYQRCEGKPWRMDENA
jgi:hypothetical protein